MGDEEQILQALLAILQNAIEASPVQGKILINTVEQDGNIKFIIEDQGHGIADDIRIQVFDPFFTTRKDGPGLGLTIAQRIVLTHHGSLTIGTPESGCGTKVVLSLPILETQEKLA
mgnify:CR=1 FL=1